MENGNFKITVDKISSNEREGSGGKRKQEGAAIWYLRVSFKAKSFTGIFLNITKWNFLYVPQYNICIHLEKYKM